MLTLLMASAIRKRVHGKSTKVSESRLSVDRQFEELFTSRHTLAGKIIKNTKKIRPPLSTTDLSSVADGLANLLNKS